MKQEMSMSCPNCNKFISVSIAGKIKCSCKAEIEVQETELKKGINIYVFIPEESIKKIYEISY